MLLYTFFFSMIHADPTCWNEESGEKKKWKVSDEKRRERQILTEYSKNSYIK
jgi:hypothetical protein